MEIGRRLNHVKEHNLVHGEFREWHENLGLDKDFAYKSMKIAKELPNVETLRHLGTTTLHLIATLPEEEKEEQIQRIEDGDLQQCESCRKSRKTQAQASLQTSVYRLKTRESSLQGRSQGNHQGSRPGRLQSHTGP